MAAHASSGRWLRGPRPYGYTLVEERSHPNPERAVSGVRLHQFEPDLEAAPMVERNFDLYVHGCHGVKSIAGLLTAEGIPCPSALAVREDRILPVLDDWLVGLFAPGRIEDVAEQIIMAHRLDHDDDH